jgi:hypothetical protein
VGGYIGRRSYLFQSRSVSTRRHFQRGPRQKFFGKFSVWSHPELSGLRTVFRFGKAV